MRPQAKIFPNIQPFDLKKPNRITPTQNKVVFIQHKTKQVLCTYLYSLSACYNSNNSFADFCMSCLLYLAILRIIFLSMPYRSVQK